MAVNALYSMYWTLWPRATRTLLQPTKSGAGLVMKYDRTIFGPPFFASQLQGYLPSRQTAQPASDFGHWISKSVLGGGRNDASNRGWCRFSGLLHPEREPTAMDTIQRALSNDQCIRLRFPVIRGRLALQAGEGDPPIRWLCAV